jgi:hypothetical protein
VFGKTLRSYTPKHTRSGWRPRATATEHSQLNRWLRSYRGAAHMTRAYGAT